MPLIRRQTLRANENVKISFMEHRLDQKSERSIALRDDLLNGADAIADYLGWHRRRVYYETREDRVKKTGFPAFKIGGVVTARRSRLEVWIRTLEGQVASRRQSQLR